MQKICLIGLYFVFNFDFNVVVYLYVGSHFPNVFLLSSAYRSSEQSFNGHGGEVVDKVVLCSDENNNLCIEVLFRHTRTAEVLSFSVYYDLVLLIRNSVFIYSLSLLH